MKLNKLFTIISLFSLAMIGCTPKEYQPLSLEKVLPTEERAATHTITQLIEKYGVGNERFGVNQIKSDSDVIIKGIITSTDEEGNIYKYIVVQEEAKDGRAIKISIDAGSLSGQYPLGQKVWIKCNDLYIGNYAQSPQLGVKYHNTRKDRIEPGRMPKFIADKAIHTYGMPDKNALKPDTMTIKQILDEGVMVYNKLVYIPNAFFTGRGVNYGSPSDIAADELIFAPSTNGVGYPQSREIQDGTGSIFVATSEYAKFASKKLPFSNMRGGITAIVSWYNDKDEQLSPKKIYYQLTLRTIKDLGKGFEEYHKQK